MNKIENYELIEAQEEAKVDFAIMLNNILEEKSISYTELSKRTGKSKSLISRIMGGSNNLTIETMVSMLYAANEKLVITTAAALQNDYAIFFRGTANITNQLDKLNSIGLSTNINGDEWKTLPIDMGKFETARVMVK